MFSYNFTIIFVFFSLTLCSGHVSHKHSRKKEHKNYKSHPVTIPQEPDNFQDAAVRASNIDPAFLNALILAQNPYPYQLEGANSRMPDFPPQYSDKQQFTPFNSLTVPINSPHVSEGQILSSSATILGIRPDSALMSGRIESQWVRNLLKDVVPGAKFQINLKALEPVSIIEENYGFGSSASSEDFLHEPQYFKTDLPKPDNPCPDIFSYQFDEILPGWAGYLVIPKFLSSRMYEIDINMTLPIIRDLTTDVSRDLEVIVFSSREEILNDDIIRCGIKFPAYLEILPRLEGMALNGNQICKLNIEDKSEKHRLLMTGDAIIRLMKGVELPTSYYFQSNVDEIASRIKNQKQVWKKGNPFGRSGTLNLIS